MLAYSFPERRAYMSVAIIGPFYCRAYPSKIRYGALLDLQGIARRLRRIGEASLQLRRLRPAAFPVRLFFARRVLITRVFRAIDTCRSDIPCLTCRNTKLSRASCDRASICNDIPFTAVIRRLRWIPYRRRIIGHQECDIGGGMIPSPDSPPPHIRQN